jgi:hypothetical protein
VAVDHMTKALLWAAVTDLDLQVYKASVYKLRWDSPGVGLDLALPCLYEARLTLDDVAEWPEAISEAAARFRSALAAYTESLQTRDHTTASAQQTALFLALSGLRAALRKL